ncbi:hypothetical protein ACFLY8_04555 [Halobacteriota archaeon]
MVLFKDGRRYNELEYLSEEDFEKDIIDNYKLFFGKKTICIDAKRKIDAKSLGGTLPDALLFDLSDIDNPEFYLVEVELASHDFYKHIFPQITKFFAFYKNLDSRKELIEKIYSIVNTDSNLKKNFKKHIGESEIYKFLSDAVESSQNILLVIDGEKKELPEIVNTYTDTWGKIVKIQTIKKYESSNEFIFSMHPDFENIEYSLVTNVEDISSEPIEISEEFHLDGVNSNVKEIYSKLKESILPINDQIIFNPQKYYISIINKKNVVFCKFRKKKILLVVMLPLDIIKSKIKHHTVKELSQSVQKFYNGPCAVVDIRNLDHFDEIVALLEPLVSL